MRKNLIRRWFIAFGVLTVLIGLIHNLFTGAMYGKALQLSSGSEPTALRFAYFFAAMGTAVILCGIMLLLAASALSRREAWARKMIWLSCAYLLLSMAGAAACGIFNPLSLIVLLGSIGSMIILLKRPQAITAGE